MRCLYCGKGLPLLKRFTKGGEFCSDAHRQQYQDEYNQLALNRLLQAKPPEKETKAEPALTPAPVMVAEPPTPAPVAVPAAEVEKPPQPAPVEEPAPAGAAGFFMEFPVPAMAQVMSISLPELELEHANAPAVPQRDFEARGTGLIAAGRLAMHPAISILDSAGRVTDRRLEVREFVRGAPVVELAVPAARETALPEAGHEPMEIPAAGYLPQEAFSLWQEPARAFEAYETELGELARVRFGTTGFGEGMPQSSPEPARRIEPAVVMAEAVLAPPVAPAMHSATHKATPDAPPAAPPNVTVSSVFRPLFGPAPQSAIPRVTEKKAEPVPEPITRPMPVTLHALAAVRGRPVQVFPADVASSVDVQIPRSNALPLRPVMTLEAAPEAVKIEEAQAEENKPAQQTAMVTEDSRLASGKTKTGQPEAPQIEARDKIELAAAPAAEKRAVEQKPVEEKIAGKKIDAAPEPKPEAPRELPAPLAKPYTPPDLGLPSLSIEASGGFFSRVSTAGKLALAALMVIAVGAAIYLTTKSGSADAAAIRSPRVVESQVPALAAGDSGWVTDWGAEPGVRRQHDISVLRPSMSLTDYRMEFQAQIENKSLGWIYRARDGRNYYVSELEIVKPGLNPTVALVRFAVVNGEEQPHAEVPLKIPVHLDTVYSIRFDAVGDRFTTFAQDQKIDEFTDDRIKTGGVGLYNEHGEQPGLKGPVRVVPLVIKK